MWVLWWLGALVGTSCSCRLSTGLQPGARADNGGAEAIKAPALL